ncbi:MAG: hypothetical protein A3F67_09180 [Verrucomicrobia bacterium RIFCSPHIGHO2_12_FULL_41_10]|nr:MAG: hypothetical protein A3F67_09180 [Verrucomicrobia bacterium RIFCSPHIGHO2_12_FULL_41_10]HLB34568.1 FtsQ-type POTRA domain-containing protein [Chthoniobacterales bacterium]
MALRRTTNTNRRSRTLRSKKPHHLLEVKMRVDTVRRQRARKINGALLKVVIVLFLLGGLYIGGQILLDKFFFKNPDYKVQNLEVSLDGVLTPQELREKTGLQEGVNIFTLDLSTAERTLSDLPDVKKARVERVLPNTLRVTIERRIPVLRLAASPEETFVAGQSLVVDQERVIMKPMTLDASLLQLPVLEGIDLSKVQLGQPLLEERLQVALNLLNALNNASDVSLVLRSIDLSRGYCAIVTDNNNTHFTFGEEHLPDQMGRLQKLLAYCQDTGREIESANLMLEHNTPVVFRPNSETSALAAQTKTKR